jgi:protein ImuB
MRVACVILPHPAVQALVRADPELAGAPLVVVDGDRVIDSAGEAARRLCVGATVSEVRALMPEARVRAFSPALAAAADAALADLAAAFSPRVDLLGPGHGEVALDVSGLGRLFADEHELARAIGRAAAKLRLEARVGIARDKATARVAARSATAEAACVVAPGREAAFLAPLPVERLDPSPEIAAQLERWGVRRIGELATLPSGGVALRLGAEGARLGRLARGEDDTPFHAHAAPLEFEEAIDFEWPVGEVGALGFVLRPLVENLVARLACRSLAVGALALTLALDRGWVDPEARAGTGCDVRTVTLAAPTRDVPTLCTLLRLELESSRPSTSPSAQGRLERAATAAPVIGVRLAARPARARPAQLGFFEPAGPSPDKLATTLGRLATLVGEDRVGAPALPDRHRPDAFAVEDFISAQKNETQKSHHEMGKPRILALHALRPPRGAEAHLDRGRLRYLSAEGLGGQVLSLAGPFRVREGWWLAPLLRDYYDVELSDGAVYRVYHDLHADSWHVDGIYE